MKENAPLLSAVVVPRKCCSVINFYSAASFCTSCNCWSCIACCFEVVINDIGGLGTRVSTERVKVLLLSDPSVFSLPSESENLEEATLITPSVVLSDVGVNVAV